MREFWRVLRDGRAVDCVRLCLPLAWVLNIKAARFACTVFMVMVLCGGVAFGLSGSGVEGDPWVIVSLGDFDEFAGDSGFWGGYVRLDVDIDLGERTYTTAVIGPDTDSSSSIYEGTPFTGVFDGNGHIVSNFSINSSGVSNNCLGLFGKIDSIGAKVENLGLENVDIIGGNYSYFFGGLCGHNNEGTISNCYAVGSVAGDFYPGGLCGLNDGTIVDCYATVSVTGTICFGGLCGTSRGSIRNCYATGFVRGMGVSEYIGGLCGYNGGDIFDSYASGSLFGGGFSKYLGGLCGMNSGGISNCYATGSVTGGDNSLYLGGLCGENGDGIISNCYATGAVTGNGNSRFLGGLCGSAYGSISNCFATGSVAGRNNSGFVGGLCGVNNGNINNCCSTGSVTGGTGSNNLGGLCGRNARAINNCYFLDPADGGGPDNGEGTPLSDTQMKLEDSFSKWDFVGESSNGTSEIWQIPAGGGYPELSYFNGYTPVALSGEGTESSPYLINNAVELGAMNHYSSKAFFKLSGDIDLSGIIWSTAVVPVFGGCFDGSGHSIYNLKIESGSYLGLFGRIAGLGPEVNNLILENVNIIGGNYSYNLGGLCGVNRGTISNCYCIGSVNGNGMVGGLCGYNDFGTISNSYCRVSVTGHSYPGGLCGYNNYGIISNSYATGSVSGHIYLGGLCGTNRGTTINCYASGSVSGDDNSSHLGGLCGKNFESSSIIINCYATGSVEGGEEGSWAIGGLCGANGGTINNCLWDVESSGFGLDGDDNFGAVGKTTEDMQSLSTFVGAGWDFVGESGNGDEDVWRMCVDGVGYPRLSWEFGATGDFVCGDGVDFGDLVYFCEGWLVDGEFGFEEFGVMAERWLEE